MPLWYPAWRYHRTMPPRLVQTPEEDAGLAPMGWVDTPATFLVPEAPPEPVEAPPMPDSDPPPPIPDPDVEPARPGEATSEADDASWGAPEQDTPTEEIPGRVSASVRRPRGRPRKARR